MASGAERRGETESDETPLGQPRTASVVVIGGGVVGCSIAYHLARRGMTEWLTDGKPSMDLSLFDPARFGPGRAAAADRGPDAE